MTAGRTIHTWPSFPIDDEEVCDFDDVCKPFPSAEILNGGKSGGVFGKMRQSLDELVARGEIQPPLSEDKLRVAGLTLDLSCTPSHIDTNCYGSGTRWCSRAQVRRPSLVLARAAPRSSGHALGMHHLVGPFGRWLMHRSSARVRRAQVVSLGVPSPSEPYFDGSFLIEGLPAMVGEDGKRHVVDWDDWDEFEGTTSAYDFFDSWEAFKKFVIRLPFGRKSMRPGNSSHMVIGVWTDGVRVRKVDYQTITHGGLATELGKLCKDRAFLPMDELKLAAEKLEPERVTWLRHAAPFDAEPVAARIITYLFYDYLVNRRHEEPSLITQGRLNAAPSTKRVFVSSGAVVGEPSVDVSVEEAPETDVCQSVVGDAVQPATQEDVVCLARIQALLKYMASLRLFLTAAGRAAWTELCVDGVDVMKYTYYFWSSRDDQLYRQWTRHLWPLAQVVWVACPHAAVANLVAFACVHYLPDVVEHVFSHILQWRPQEAMSWDEWRLQWRPQDVFSGDAMGLALRKLDVDPGGWLEAVGPLVLSEKVRGRLDRFELRPTTAGHTPADMMLRLREFATNQGGARSLATATSYGQVQQSLLRMAPKCVTPCL